MLNFVLINILFVSIGVIIYIFARSLPRIEEKEKEKEPEMHHIDKFLVSDLPNKIDFLINFYTAKILRRLKIWSMRFDNYLTESLKKINLQNKDDKKIKLEDLNNNAEEQNEENKSSLI
jgi:hypothetical protein